MTLVSWFLVRFEEGLYRPLKGGKYGLSSRCAIQQMDDVFSLKACLNWFDMLLAALDCYCWVFGQGLLTPAAIFTGACVHSCGHSVVSFQHLLVQLNFYGGIYKQLNLNYTQRSRLSKSDLQSAHALCQ